MTCPHCQAPSVPHARFCAQCGVRLVDVSASAGDRRVVTVLFTDVSGFTAMSEKLDPEAVTAIVNRFFEVLTEPIYRFGGVVDKYIGDAIMALFGAPIAHEDDPERALAAAWEMQQAARIFADRLEADTGIRLRVRVGLHTGLVIAGEVGGEQKRDYTVQGETVSLASRMEAHATPGAILVSEATYRLTRQAWHYAERDAVSIPGRTAAVRAFEPLGPQARDAGARRERVAFVGRGSELSLLHAACEKMMAGTPQAVWVSGEAGVGKSRLVREALARFEGVRILRARCLSYRRATSDGLIAALLEDWLGEEGLAGLEGWCRTQGAADAAREAELLGYFLGREIQSAELRQLSAQALRGLALQTLDQRLLSLEGPLVLSLSDLQWADEASRDWLVAFVRRLARAERPLRLLVLGQSRLPSDLAAFEATGLDATSLLLASLARAESDALIREFLGLGTEDEAAGCEEVLAEVAARAEGNPLYLCELLRSLVEAGALVRQANGWRLDPERRPGALPTTIQGVVAARVDRLSVTARRALQVGAVMGREFSSSLLCAVAGLPAPEAALGELTRADLIHPRARQTDLYAFNQALIQEVAYEGILLKERRLLHGRVGHRLEAEIQGQPGEKAALLALHFLRAEAWPQALRYQLAAGLFAQRRFDAPGSRAHLEEALTLRERLSYEDAPTPSASEIHAALAAAESTLGSYPVALDHLARALDGAASGTERSGIRRAEGGIHERLGRYEEAIACYQAGLADLAAGEAPERAALLGAIAYAEVGLGRFEAAIARCQTAAEGLGAEEARKDLAFCHSVTGIALGKLGRYPEALGAHRRALVLREACEDTLGVGSSCNNLFQLHYELGEFEEARRFIERAIAAFTRVGDQSRIAMGHSNLGALLLEQDELAAAEAHFREALAICRRIGFASREGGILCNLGEACSKQGRHAEAIALIADGLRALEALRNAEILGEGYRLLAEACLADAQPQAAWEAIVRGIRLVGRGKSEAQRAVFWALAGEAFLRAGRHAQANRHLQRAIHRLSMLGNRLELGRARFRLARAHQAAGCAQEAAEQAEAAAALFKALSARYDQRALSAWCHASALASPASPEEVS
ncbi:tetratricopeptide repeat protein [bacterium]|nr:tetratricopeptide repeat protein [bacterium]